MSNPQTLRFNRHKVHDKLWGAYVFIGKNTPLWSAVHKQGIGDGYWSIATWNKVLYIRPFQEGDGWTDARLQTVKSGAFRLYISLAACPAFEYLPKKFSISGTTVTTDHGGVAWAGDIPCVK